MTDERQTALITGATGGIGRALADALAPHYDLILQGRDPARLQELSTRYPRSRALTVDLRHPETFSEAMGGITPLHALVHNAGVVDLGSVADTSVDVWRDTLAVNLVAPAALTRALLPALREARGHVLFVNSGAGLTANAGWGAYAASKFGLRALADALRAEEAQHGVRVTTVYPGRTATDMQRRVRQQEGAPYHEDAYIQPASVASAALTALLLPRDAHLTDVTVRPGA